MMMPSRRKALLSSNQQYSAAGVEVDRLGDLHAVSHSRTGLISPGSAASSSAMHRESKNLLSGSIITS